MKSKLLPALLILLFLLNGVLIFMLVKKPHENQRNHQKRNFLTEQLGFSETQKDKFRELDKIHWVYIEGLDKEIRENKDVLFNSFSKENFNLDSLTSSIGLLEAKKESEVFNFFNKVRNLCTLEQTNKFDEIIKEALKGGDKRPPRDRKSPPNRNEGLPPPN